MFMSLPQPVIIVLCLSTRIKATTKCSNVWGSEKLQKCSKGINTFARHFVTATDEDGIRWDENYRHLLKIMPQVFFCRNHFWPKMTHFMKVIFSNNVFKSTHMFYLFPLQEYIKYILFNKLDLEVFNSTCCIGWKKSLIIFSIYS